jgi:hypothetical protein
VRRLVLVRRFSDAGTHDANHALRRPASEKRQIGTVVGDAYAGEWVAGAWSRTGVSYVRSDLPKSQIYLEVLPCFTRELVNMPEHGRLIRELRLLERRTHRSGKDAVDHPKNGRDDHANSVCGGAARALSLPGRIRS